MPLRFALAALACLSGPAAAAGGWTAPGFDMPESVLFDPVGGRLFVSNIAGEMDAKDGQGRISVLGLDGRMIAPDFAAGLDAPKGMALAGGRLFVSDIDRLVAIDPATGAVAETWSAEGAVFLNDVAAEGETVFVSDLVANRIYALEDGKLGLWLESEDLDHPNGLAVAGGRLHVAGWGRGLREDGATETPGRLLAVDLGDRKITPLTGPLGNLDGLRPDGRGGWFVTDFIAGRLLRVDADGRATELADLDAGAADLEVLPEQDLALIPMMFSGAVVARPMD